MKAKLCLLVVFVLSIVMSGLVSPVVAIEGLGQEEIRFYGVIKQEGNLWSDCPVEITKYNSGSWDSLGTDTTDIDGNYNIPLTGYVGFWDERKEDEYKLYINGDNVADETIDSDWLYENEYEYYNTSEAEWITVKQYSHDWNYDSNPIPEFPAISIPVVAILGLLFFFSYRKRRKGEDTKEKTQDFEVGKQILFPVSFSFL